MRQQGFDDRQARLGVKQNILESFQSQTEALAGRFQNEQIKQNALAFQAGLQKEKSDTQIAQYVASRPRQEFTSTFQTVTPGTGGGKVGGRELPASEVASLGELNSIKTRVGALKTEWQQLASKMGSGALSKLPWTDASKYNDTVKSELSNMIRALGEKGVLTEADVKRAQDAIPSPWDTKDKAMHKIQTLDRIMGSIYDSKLNAFEATGFNIGNLRNIGGSADDFANKIGGVRK